MARKLSEDSNGAKLMGIAQWAGVTAIYTRAKWAMICVTARRKSVLATAPLFMARSRMDSELTESRCFKMATATKANSRLMICMDLARWCSTMPFTRGSLSKTKCMGSACIAGTTRNGFMWARTRKTRSKGKVFTDSKTAESGVAPGTKESNTTITPFS